MPYGMVVALHIFSLRGCNTPIYLLFKFIGYYNSQLMMD
jgi:hypothetical protein